MAVLGWNLEVQWEIDGSVTGAGVGREETSRLTDRIYRESSLKGISLSSIVIVLLLWSKARPYRGNSRMWGQEGGWYIQIPRYWCQGIYAECGPTGNFGLHAYFGVERERRLAIVTVILYAGGWTFKFRAKWFEAAREKIKWQQMLLERRHRAAYTGQPACDRRLVTVTGCQQQVGTVLLRKWCTAGWTCIRSTTIISNIN